MFVVMSLLGADLSRLRAEMPNKRFALSTTLRIGMQTANALQELHACQSVILLPIVFNTRCTFLDLSLVTLSPEILRTVWEGNNA